MVKFLILAVSFFLPAVLFAQVDSAFLLRLKSLETENTLRLDTMPVPNDALTKKIRLLRNEKQGFNTELALKLKLSEEQQKDTSHAKQYYERLLNEVLHGHTSKLLENAVINNYRKIYNEKEIDELIAFYKTSAGKKMDKEYILLILATIKNAGLLMKMAAEKINDK